MFFMSFTESYKDTREKDDSNICTAQLDILTTIPTGLWEWLEDRGRVCKHQEFQVWHLHRNQWHNAHIVCLQCCDHRTETKIFDDSVSLLRT